MRLRGKNLDTGAVETVEIAGAAVVDGRRELGDDGCWLAPGLFDLQVNGFAGVDFNAASVTVEDYRHAVRRMWASGVTRFLPTMITGARERIVSCMRTAAAAAED